MAREVGSEAESFDELRPGKRLAARRDNNDRLVPTCCSGTDIYKSTFFHSANTCQFYERLRSMYYLCVHEDTRNNR